MRGFGEAEYWFSLIKVATVIIFIIVGVMMIVGIFKGRSQPAGATGDRGCAVRRRFLGDDWRGDDCRLSFQHRAYRHRCR
ncbi:hypothetical protein [Klebsiella pneumoniae]|uniref:hypothetical protein n=1 Tax=Klebsiella pneumoniae TaxID=573 RepID=UPI002B3FFC9D|nr:hypothetical protein [Klebsiella pneumoniae]